MLRVYNSLVTKSYSDPMWGTAAKLLNNQIAYAKYYTERLRADTSNILS